MAQKWPITLKYVLKLETVISELQLFGSVKQVELAKQLADAVVKGGEFFLDDLLNDLRNTLRAELELEPIYKNIVWLRFNNKAEEAVRNL